MAQGDLLLHPTKGANPRLTSCRACGKDVGVALLGAHDKVWACSRCNQRYIGKPQFGKCQKCGGYGQELRPIKTIGEHEKLPIELCNDCEKLEEEKVSIVKAGGILFKCADCGSEGAIRASAPLAGRVREQLGVAPPKPCGVEFSKADCPACGPNKVEST